MASDYSVFGSVCLFSLPLDLLSLREGLKLFSLELPSQFMQGLDTRIQDLHSVRFYIVCVSGKGS